MLARCTVLALLALVGTDRMPYTYNSPIIISPCTLAVMCTSTAMSSLMLICKLGSLGFPSASLGSWIREPEGVD